MRVLITGINGFVGSHMADYLIAKKDIEVYGGIKVNGRMRYIHHIKDQIKLIEYDLIDYFSVKNLLQVSKPDQIYHFAALSWVSPSWNMPSAYMQVNAIGTINLLEAIRELKLKTKVLVSCTPEEFGDVLPENLPITEETAIAPVNHYAASKVAQDAVCTSYGASYKMPIIRTRAFNHEGPRRDISGALASFAYQIAMIEAGKQKPIIKVGNLEAKRNFTHVNDMVRAYNLAMEKCTPNELYLIGSENIYTIKECLEKLISLSTMKGKIKYEVDSGRVRPTELRYLIGDCSKFEKATGWKPEINFEQTLMDILDYWRNFVNNNLY